MEEEAILTIKDEVILIIKEGGVEGSVTRVDVATGTEVEEGEVISGEAEGATITGGEEDGRD